jgi:hypothetical protein
MRSPNGVLEVVALLVFVILVAVWVTRRAAARSAQDTTSCSCREYPGDERGCVEHVCSCPLIIDTEGDFSGDSSKYSMKLHRDPDCLLHGDALVGKLLRDRRNSLKSTQRRYGDE